MDKLLITTYLAYANMPIPRLGEGGLGGPGGAGLSIRHFGKFCHPGPYGAELRSRIFWVPGPQGQGRISQGSRALMAVVTKTENRPVKCAQKIKTTEQKTIARKA